MRKVLIFITIILFGMALVINFFHSPRITRITRQDGNYIYCDTSMRCPDSQTATFAVAGPAGYEPSRHDTCIHCKQLYRKHNHILSQDEEDSYEVMDVLMSNPN